MKTRVIFAFCLSLIVATSSHSPAQEGTGEPDSGGTNRLIEEVSTEEVKLFLDPTQLIHRLGYAFELSYLPSDIELIAHRVSTQVGIRNSMAVWADISVLDFNIPGQGGPTGLGDLKLGAGIVAYENLRKRLTSVALVFESRLPTGDASEGLGLDKTVVAPGVYLGLNLTDLFPVFVTAWYRHSIEGGGSDADSDDRVRAIDLTLQTFHILPKGFFLALIPSFFVDLEGDTDVFSLGLGVGRALNRRVSLQGGYIQRVAGEETFSRGFSVGLTWLWGSMDDGR